MPRPMSRISKLITELSELEQAEPKRDLGDHGSRSKEIRQELVQLVRRETDE